jgi:hypothetical protein
MIKLGLSIDEDEETMETKEEPLPALEKEQQQAQTNLISHSNIHFFRTFSQWEASSQTLV